MKPPPGYTGHARDFAKGEVVPDPKVEITPNVKLLTRVDGMTVIFDRRLPLGENAGVYADANAAELAARKKYAHEIGPKAAAKQSASDEELFAGMKRAAARGFAVHEPACIVHDLQGPPAPEGVEDLRKGRIIGRCFRCGRDGVGVNEECSAAIVQDGVELVVGDTLIPTERGTLTIVRVDTIVATLCEPDEEPVTPPAGLVTLATEEDVTRFVSLDELFGDEPVTSVDALEPPARAVVSSYERDDVAIVPCCAAPFCALDCVCACHDDEPPRLE